MTGFRGYLVKRIFHSLLTVWAVAILVFLLFRLAPGDPTAYLVVSSFAPELADEILARYVLNLTLWQQCWHYMGRLLRGDLAVSFISHKPVVRQITEQFWTTIVLSGAAFLTAYTPAAIGGVYLAYRRGTSTESIGVA